MSRQRIAEIEQEICKLEVEKIEQERNLFVKCKGMWHKGCGRRTIIKNLTLFRSRWRTSTYG